MAKSDWIKKTTIIGGIQGDVARDEYLGRLDTGQKDPLAWM